MGTRTPLFKVEGTVTPAFGSGIRRHLYVYSRVGHWSPFQNPTQPKISGPNPTHHRHLVWHIRLYRKLTVTRHRQVHSSQTLHSTSQLSMKDIIQLQYSLTDSIVYFMTLKISRSQVSTQPNPTHGWTQPMTNSACTTYYVLCA